MDRLFTGIKPTGNAHIGNYIGAIKNSLDIYENYDSIFCIVDQHAITVPWEPKQLNDLTSEIATIYLASGINPEKATFFIQSENPDHAYLNWIFNCITAMGKMSHMIQFKEKSSNPNNFVSVGLFDYPILMAADILLYDTKTVPVGEDQAQHIELAIDIANKFNQTFGTTFRVPEVRLLDKGNRIMSLQYPDKKMSKSENDRLGCIYMLDNPDDAVKKIKKAVTDSESIVKYDPENKKAISNLLELYSALTDKSIETLERKYTNSSYGEFKSDLAEVVFNFLSNFQNKYYQLKNDPTFVQGILKKGLNRSRDITNKKIIEVKEKIGFRTSESI